MVDVISAVTNAVVETIQVGAFPEGMAYDPTTGDIYVDDSYSGAVSIIVPHTTQSTSGPSLGFLGLPGSEGYIVIGVIVAVVAAVVAVMLIRKRKGAQPSAPSQPQTLQQSPPKRPPPPP
jgi:DNA-binding beta-propeller fold protein YncE